MTAARFPIKQSAIAVVISGLEEIQNSGKEAMIDLVRARVDTAEDTFWNQMSAGVYSDGTGFGGKQIGGLSLLISKAPTTGIVGGVDRSVQLWWQNVAVNQTVDTKSTVTALNIQAYMNAITLSVKRNTDGIDLIVFDNNFYQFYLASLQTIQRIADEGRAKDVGAGWTSLKYFGAGKSVDVVLDGSLHFRRKLLDYHSHARIWAIFNINRKDVSERQHSSRTGFLYYIFPQILSVCNARTRNRRG